MSNLEYKLSYKRKLPHIQPKGSIIFVTFRLAGSIPKSVLENLQWEYENHKQKFSNIKDKNIISDKLWELKMKYFEKIDAYLDRKLTGPFWLRNQKIAEIVEEALHYRDKNVYDLFCYCIMSNHVHSLFSPLPKYDTYQSLSSIMHSLKRYTSRGGNRVLGRSGTFWAHESYDHYIRDADDFERVVDYILSNPVHAGLVKEWYNWKWTYVRNDILQ